MVLINFVLLFIIIFWAWQRLFVGYFNNISFNATREQADRHWFYHNWLRKPCVIDFTVSHPDPEETNRLMEFYRNLNIEPCNDYILPVLVHPSRNVSIAFKDKKKAIAFKLSLP